MDRILNSHLQWSHKEPSMRLGNIDFFMNTFSPDKLFLCSLNKRLQAPSLFSGYLENNMHAILLGRTAIIENVDTSNLLHKMIRVNHFSTDISC